jgi:hypothetical protein
MFEKEAVDTFGIVVDVRLLAPFSVIRLSLPGLSRRSRTRIEKLKRHFARLKKTAEN